MESRLTKRLADNAAKENRSNARFNLSVFLLLKEEIYEAIDDGWSIKYIWELLYNEGKVGFSYQTFLNFVNKNNNGKPKKSKKNISENELKQLPRTEPEQKTELDSEVVEKPDTSQNRLADTKTSKKRDYGNPKGFEWDTDFDPKDFV